MDSLHNMSNTRTAISRYRLVREKFMTRGTITMLVTRFAEHYHPYLPLTPRRYLDPRNLDTFAIESKQLLTAIITISSMNLVDQPHIHTQCSAYMQELICEISNGIHSGIGAVEALLLLAEWEPYGLHNHLTEIGKGEENRCAWMHTGIALRAAYFLGLDRASFRDEEPALEVQQSVGRSRLVWIYCYITDRLISICSGQNFYTRGPGPSLNLEREDFPDLNPEQSGEEDYAQILRAILDLTQIYSNVHDVLYTRDTPQESIHTGQNYLKIVEAFRLSLLQWKQAWALLNCSPHLKNMIWMLYENLSLYVNASAFQVIFRRLITQYRSFHLRNEFIQEYLISSFKEVNLMPEYPFIQSSISAAKSYLILLVNGLDPERHLRHIPTRFYMYAIYSAVFLYKIRSLGLLTHEEEVEVQHVVRRSIVSLQAASVSDHAVGARHAQLLSLLWLRDEERAAEMTQSWVDEEGAEADRDIRRDRSESQPHSSHFKPFSWLDLEGVNRHVLGFEEAPALGQLTPTDDVEQEANTFKPQERNEVFRQLDGAIWSIDLDGGLMF